MRRSRTPGTTGQVGRTTSVGAVRRHTGRRRRTTSAVPRPVGVGSRSGPDRLGVRAAHGLAAAGAAPGGWRRPGCAAGVGRSRRCSAPRWASGPVQPAAWASARLPRDACASAPASRLDTPSWYARQAWDARRPDTSRTQIAGAADSAAARESAWRRPRGPREDARRERHIDRREACVVVEIGLPDLAVGID